MSEVENYKGAYHGDSLLRQRTLARLRSLARAGNWVPRPVFWDGATGSLVGTLLEGEDLDRWESELGLPKWLALLADGVLVTAPDVAQGAEAGIELLTAVEPGCEMRARGSRCILALLQGPQHGLATMQQSQALAVPLEEVASLHHARMQGEEVSPVQWRHARKAAMQATNNQEKGSVEAAVGACIEAAAWDPALSRTAVSDTLRSWSWAMAAASPPAELPDMSKEEEAAIRTLLRKIYAEARAEAGGDDSGVDVLKLAQERHPEVYGRIQASTEFQRQEQRKRTQTLWKCGVETMRCALAR